jgi:uncharacterized Zn-binding protein involved in type VI secretion/8-oxo-dGTP pyrophosphatase MutT (NUDIX family)
VGAVLAARLGDQVGSHPSGFWALVGMIAGAIVGAVVGAILIVATGGTILVLAAVVGAVSMAAAASAAGERLGEAFDEDEADAAATPCSPIVSACKTVFIENVPAARVYDPASLCLITKTPAIVKQGSAHVYIGGQPASRHNDKVTCTGKINVTAKYTYIGGPTAEAPEPYQPTFAGAIHEIGTKFEGLAEKTGKVALGLAFVAAPFATVAFYYVGKVVTAGGEKLGALIDDELGYKDKRFEHFTGTAAGIALAYAGARMAHGADEALPEGEAGIAEPPEDLPVQGDEPILEEAPNEPAEPPEEPPEPPEPPEEPRAPGEMSPTVKEAIKDLPPDEQAQIAKSPRLQRQIEALRNDPNKPWEIKSDPSKRGAGANRGNKEITLGKGYDNAGTVAHEVGHATFKPGPEPSTDATVTRDQYVEESINRNLQDEGAARLNEFEANDEITGNGGRKVVDDPANEETYRKYKAGEISEAEAQRRMGETFRNRENSLTGETYEDYYGNDAAGKWDSEVQPARDMAAANKAKADGSLSAEEADAQIDAAAQRQMEARLKNIKAAAKRGEITDQQAADYVRSIRKANIKARAFRANASEMAKLGRDFADGKISRETYDAETSRLFAEFNALATSPAPESPVCATCDGAGEAPSASDLLARDPAAPAPKNGKGGGAKAGGGAKDETPAGDAGKPVEWTAHGNKHVASTKVAWSKIVEGTATGPARYKPGTDVEALERQVWEETGTDVTNGRPWKVQEFPDEIGASEGKPSRWIRVENSGNTIHGHPISEAEYLKLTKEKK